MTHVSKGERRADEAVERIAGTMQHGLLLVDSQGEVLWMDKQTRGRMDGELSKLSLPLDRQDRRTTVDCFLTTAQVDLVGGSRQLCVIQAIAPNEASERDLRPVIDAIEEVLAEPSWFTQPLLAKLKARLQAGRPPRRASDLERLTAREREILALVCEGCTDAEMSRRLNLSQNTVRNHLASLFRKIGVNRRSAAVIWARERAITKHDMLAMSSRRSRRSLS